MNEQSTGLDVLARAREGDERAFLALYRAAQPGLLRYLAVIVDEAAADELAAATWQEITRELADFPGTLDGFRTWVAAVGRRLALDHLDAVRSGAVAPREVVVPAQRAIPERTARALRMMGRLPSGQAEAVALRSVVGLDATAAAEVLGVRTGALRRAARKGLHALSRRLEATAAATVPQEVDLREASGGTTVRNLRVVPETAGPPVPQWTAVPRAAAPATDPVPRLVRRDLTPTIGIEVSR